MKYVMISLCIVGMVFAANVVSAECMDRAKLIGTWERFDADLEKIGADVAATMQAIEAGEKPLEEFLDEYGAIDGSVEGSEITELLESGEMILVASMTDSFSAEDADGYYYMTLKGTWSLDCAQLSRETTSVEKVEVDLAHLTAEQKKNVEQEAAEMQEMIAGSVERVLNRFGSQPGGEILYLSDTYALINDTENEIAMIFKKK